MRAITKEEYKEIIDTMESGFLNHRPNHKIATALRIVANLGLRIGDTLNLKLSDIVYEGGRYHLDIIEQKTQKKRVFTVPLEIVEYIRQYTRENGIKENEFIFGTITERPVQRHLKLVCDYLEIENVSTHSFRKMFATEIYKNNDYNVVLVQQLLQHSSPAITQRYIGISTQEIENALANHICL